VSLANIRRIGFSPRLVIFAITSHCNARCTTCSFPKMPADARRHVDVEQARKAVDFLARNGVRMISITGGEPLMHPGFLDICRAIVKRGLVVSYIATNGILLTQDVARELSRLGVNMVGLSIDLAGEDGTGRTRRYDVDAVASRAKRLLDLHGIPCYAGILPGRNPDDTRAILAKCESMGFKRVVVSYPQCRMGSSYRAAAEGPDTSIDSDTLREIASAIKAEKRRRRRLSVFNTDVNLDELAVAAGGGRPSYSCPAGRWQFYLDWDLRLYRCLNDPLVLGNLLELDGLEFCCGGCQGCTQQAFLDYASYYRAIELLGGLVAAVRNGEGAGIGRILLDRDNRRAVRSVVETYLGGFV